MTCDCFTLKVVGGFSSFPDYDSHKQAIAHSGLFLPVPVGHRFADVGGVDEYWYKCTSCGQLWRLVEPDPPFRGIWSKVTEE